MSFPRYNHDAVLADPATKLAAMRDLMRAGAIIVDDVPENEKDSTTLHAFVDDVLGGMQKDPCRDERNWKIVKKRGASSISYDPEKRLNNHTDQSVPPWGGVPALVLIMHYQKGSGCNTLVDGFAVAEALRAEDPDAFEMLATYGSNQTRDFVSSRKDTTQALDASLCVHKREPIIQLDDAGAVRRIQYNEVFRTPLELPFDVFPRWYAAYTKWVTMIHDPKYEVEVDMRAGKMLVFHNWRTLHGRAGGRASADRTLIGGTVTREAFFSRAAELLEVVGGQRQVERRGRPRLGARVGEPQRHDAAGLLRAEREPRHPAHAAAEPAPRRFVPLGLQRSRQQLDQGSRRRRPVAPDDRGHQRRGHVAAQARARDDGERFPRRQAQRQPRRT